MKVNFLQKLAGTIILILSIPISMVIVILMVFSEWVNLCYESSRNIADVWKDVT